MVTTFKTTMITKFNFTSNIESSFHKSSLLFFINILSLVFGYAIIYLSYFMLEGDKETFVKILLIMSECSAIYFCFCAKNELSRFQAVFSFFLSYLLNMIILEKLSVFFYLFFLLLVVEYKGFFHLNLAFFFILLAFLLICPEIMLWEFALVVQLVFLYLLQFFFQKFFHIDDIDDQSGSTPTKSLFFSLLFLLVFLFFIGDFDLRDTGFHLKILFLGAGSLVIYFCFLSKTGWELVITSLCYTIINIIIGGVIADSRSVFLRSSILYLTVILFIFFNIYCASLKRDESLTSIYNQLKVRILLSKLVFILVILSYIRVNSTYSWIWPWLATFASQIGVLNLFFFFFNKKEDEFFQTLGRKETTFLSRLVIYGSAVFFFLLYPAAAFIFLMILFLFRHLYKFFKKMMTDYVSNEMTRTWILVYLRLFFLIVIKDVFLSVFFFKFPIYF